MLLNLDSRALVKLYEPERGSIQVRAALADLESLTVIRTTDGVLEQAETEPADQRASGQRETFTASGCVERVVERQELHLLTGLGGQAERGGEVNRVVRAEVMALGEAGGMLEQLRDRLNHGHPRELGQKKRPQTRGLPRGEPRAPMGSRERPAHLNLGERRGRAVRRRVYEPPRRDRVQLGLVELHQRAAVDVQKPQRRPSRTRSASSPAISTGWVEPCGFAVPHRIADLGGAGGGPSGFGAGWVGIFTSR